MEESSTINSDFYNWSSFIDWLDSDDFVERNNARGFWIRYSFNLAGDWVIYFSKISLWTLEKLGKMEKKKSLCLLQSAG